MVLCVAAYELFSLNTVSDLCMLSQIPELERELM